MVFNKDTDRSVELEIASIPEVGSIPKPVVWQLDFEAASPEFGMNPIFTNYTIQSINIEVRDGDKPPQCKSTGDPHITTFPNAAGVTNLYHTYGVGVYYLVRLQTRNLEIQVQHIPCGGGTSCNCGVIAREHNIIIGITKCNQPSPLLIEYQFDKESATGTINAATGGWEISLPSGIVIKVIGWDKYYMNLYVTAIRSELTQYDGLCSAFSVPRDSICTSNCDRYRVPSEKSLFSITDNNLPKCWNGHMPVPKCTCIPKADRGRQPGDAILISCGVPSHDPRVIIDLTRVCRKHKRQITNNSSDDGDFSNDDTFTLDEFNNDEVPVSTTTTAKGDEDSRPLQGIGGRFFKRMYNQNVLVERSLSFEDGRERCRSALQLSFAHELCSSKVDTSAIVDTCALDVKMMNDYGPSKSAPTQFEMACLNNLHLSLETYTSKDLHQFQELKTLLSRVEKLVCPSQCNQNGRCINSICHCDDGYIGIDCSLKKGQVPVLQRIFAPLCDINKHPCKQIHLVATDFTKPADVLCRLRSVDGSIGDVPGIQYSTPVVSGGLVICNLPLMPISKDEVNNRMNTNTFLIQVSISNDGQTYSQELPFTVYDGGCMECPASQGSPCQLKGNTCSIRGRCYRAGDRCQENDARICNPSKCGTKWSSSDSVDCSDGFEECN